jgi:magnesium chelatase family protein
MGLAVLKSRGLAGMEAPEVTVEVHLANGLPTFTIVGLPDTEVRESKDRVRAALLNTGFEVLVPQTIGSLVLLVIPERNIIEVDWFVTFCF